MNKNEEDRKKKKKKIPIEKKSIKSNNSNGNFSTSDGPCSKLRGSYKKKEKAKDGLDTRYAQHLRCIEGFFFFFSICG